MNDSWQPAHLQEADTKILGFLYGKFWDCFQMFWTCSKFLTNRHMATRPLSRCYLRSYLVKSTAGAHQEPGKNYKNNLRTLKSKSYEQCRTKHEHYNNKTPHFLTTGIQVFRSDKRFENIQNHARFDEFYWDVTICRDMFYDLKRSFLI